MSVSNSLSGRHWELDQVPAVGDPTDIVQLGTGHRVAASEGQRRVALQRRVAAYLVVGGLEVIVPGDRRVSRVKVAAALAVDRLRLASAEVVKEATGYWPGGVPPIGHRQPLEVVIDRRVFDHDIGGCVATFQKRQESSWRRAPAAFGFDGGSGSKVLKFRIISSDKSAD